MGWETDYLGEARAAIVGAGTEQELEDARIAYLGRRSRLTEALRGAKDLSVEERAELNRTKAALAEEQVDVTLPGTAIPRGHLHLITQVRREVEDTFIGLGYEIFDGPEIED